MNIPIILLLIWLSAFQGGAHVLASTDQAVEEITVIGRKSLRFYKRESVMAEDRFYDLYSALNTDSEFDISCTKVAPVGTLIKSRECIPNFVRFATARESKAIMLNIPHASAALEIKMKQLSLFEKMETLTERNPELLRALVELANAQETYKTVREERFSEKWINY